jgi:hypothetical protein
MKKTLIFLSTLFSFLIFSFFMIKEKHPVFLENAHIIEDAKEKCHPDAHPLRLVNTPKNQDHGQKVGCPSCIAHQQHVEHHVEQLGRQQAQENKPRVGWQQQLLTTRHDHRGPPLMGKVLGRS